MTAYHCGRFIRSRNRLHFARTPVHPLFLSFWLCSCCSSLVGVLSFFFFFVSFFLLLYLSSNFDSCAQLCYCLWMFHSTCYILLHVYYGHSWLQQLMTLYISLWVSFKKQELHTLHENLGTPTDLRLLMGSVLFIFVVVLFSFILFNLLVSHRPFSCVCNAISVCWLQILDYVFCFL